MEEEKPYYVELRKIKHAGEVIFARSRREAEEKVLQNSLEPSWWGKRDGQWESDVEIVAPDSTYLDIKDDVDGVISKSDYDMYTLNDTCDGTVREQIEDYLHEEE